MRVLIISDMFPRSDNVNSGRFVLDQVKALLSNGLDVKVICPIPRFISSLSLTSNLRRTALKSHHKCISGVDVAYIPYWNLPLSIGMQFTTLFLYLALLKHIKAEVKRRAVDIIHAHRVFPIGYVSMLLARRLGLPCAISAHGSDIHTHPLRSKKIHKFTRKTIAEADQLLAVSTDLANSIQRLENPRNPIRVVYNGIDLDLFQPILPKADLRRLLRLPEKGIGICFAGRITRDKGVQELMSAFESLSDANPTIWLLIIGGGPLKEALRLKLNTLNNRVFFAGQVPHDEMVKYLNAADIFVMASYKEGASLVVLEAMACGLPVVATSVGIVPELAIGNICGFVIPARETYPLTSALQGLIRDEELRLRMGKAARDTIVARFESSSTAALLTRVYEQMGRVP